MCEVGAKAAVLRSSPGIEVQQTHGPYAQLWQDLGSNEERSKV